MAEPSLSDFQVDVLRMFFSLPESDGFILAGGAGLIAVGLSTRPTDDLDLFTAAASVGAAGDALEHAASERGWCTERMQESLTFRRLVLATVDGDEVLVDLAQDAGPLSEATVTAVGPAYPPAELAARKVLALFDRAALRDFVDVANVSGRYDRGELLHLAAEIDEGFDVAVFTQMLGTLGRFDDDEIRPLADPVALRSFFADWIDGLPSRAS
jgi:predicted nucleotidyltransferase component of viral defense system